MFWDDRRAELRRLIQEGTARDFLSWGPICWTMNVGNMGWVQNEWDSLQESPRWSNFLLSYEESSFSNTFPTWNNTKLLGNTIHHAYHLKQLEDKIGKTIEGFDSILEFGSGYGSMSRVCRGAGFKGRYITVDFPELNYLANLFSPGNEQYERLEDVPKNHYDLVISTWTISETNPVVRKQLIEGISYNHCLIAFAPTWEGMNNRDYFASMSGNCAEIHFNKNNFYYIK